MALKKKNWTYKNQDYEAIEKLSGDLGITKTTAKILLNRNIKEIEEAKRFLNPSIEDLIDPFLLKDMTKAVARINQAIRDNQAIWVYGDYDVDGVTSVALMIKYFNSINYPIQYYIPDRVEEGYGVNKNALDEIAKSGGQLIITVDCGITSIEEVEYAKSLGVDMIITDHHHCHNILPDAYAIINPKQSDCQYPFKQLCGCGVAFKLIQALTPPETFYTKAYEYLELVAIATVADIVPLVQENRVFVKYGLRCMKKSNNPGIIALIEICQLRYERINSSHIAFMIAPRINAVGRINSAELGVKLLTADNYTEAVNLAKILDEENRNRQELERNILVEALKMIEEDPRYKRDKVLILHKEGWHHGVIGIVASRILEKFYKPTIIFSVEEGIAKGSARSIPGLDIFYSLSQCKDLILQFGGHEQAAGVSLMVDKIDDFREKINNIADGILKEEDLIPKISCDDIMSFKDINEQLIEELENLEPFGMQNPLPKFLNYSINLKDAKTVGLESKHLKLYVEEADSRFDAIGFGLGEYKDYISSEDKIALVFSPEINEYNGSKKIQLNVKDIKIMKGSVLSKSLIAEEYYKHLEFHRYNYFHVEPLLKYNLFVFENNKDERIHRVLQTQKKSLIIVNTLNQASNLISLSEISEEDRETDIKVFYHEITTNCKDNDLHIVINPNIDKIPFKIYNNIIVYDMFFRWDDYNYLANKVKDKNLQFYYAEGDEKSNIEVLKSIIPTRDYLVILYKTLQKHNGSKPVEINKLLEEIKHNSNIIINERLLKNSLEVFEDGKLIVYSICGNLLDFKVLDNSRKINIKELNTYKHYKSLLNSFIDFTNEWPNQIKGGNYNGFI